MSDFADLKVLIDQIRNNPTNLNLYLERGIIWFEFKCYDECVSDLFFYESNGGTDPVYMKYLGMALGKTTSKRSLEYLKKYADSNESDMDALVYLADSYFDNGDYQSSAIMFHRAIDNGLNPGILREKASFLAGQKMYDEAGFFDPAFGKKKSIFRR